MRYLMTFSYDGSKYNGYQKQIGAKTVQNEIEKVLTRLNSNQFVSIHASGRTDASVHAMNQKAHFDFNKPIKLDIFRYSLNSLLPKDIYVKDIVAVKDNFHARFSVQKKEYIYKINMGEYNPIEKDYVYQYNKKLNIEAIKASLQYLEGTHDFKAFVKVDGQKDFIRTIFKIGCVEDGDLLTFSFLGNGFLRYQVRNMVGTLLEVGSGKRKSEEIKFILDSKDRTKAGKIAPACGLYLKEVFY